MGSQSLTHTSLLLGALVSYYICRTQKDIKMLMTDTFHSLCIWQSYLSFFLCIKYLCRKKIVLLSIAAVMMSCALLIVVASLFSGFIQAVETSAGEHLGDVVISPGPWNRISKYDKLVENLKAQGLGAYMVGKVLEKEKDGISVILS